MSRHYYDEGEMQPEDVAAPPSAARRWFYLYLVIAGLATLLAVGWVIWGIYERQQQLRDQGYIEGYEE